MTSTAAGVQSGRLRSLLKTHFGFDSFLPMQEEIITHVLSGRDGLVLMPTGGGKSLCYQLPALSLDGVALVVSPLIALMKDQVDSLQANGIPAEFLNSSLPPAKAAHVRSQAIGGVLKVLYIAPERLATPGFSEFLRALDISLLAIDEAHCISVWGHDFRPDYRNLKALRDGRPSIPMLALTATAIPTVREDIISQLELREPRTFLASFNRPNLVYRIEPKAKTFDRLLQLLQRHSGESAIVYCFSRRETERIAGDLQANGINALPYHAGLNEAVRKETQEQFIRDAVPVVIATIAFGMGIDKPDVRLVVHYSFPKTIESYYQETGRAGRDGLPGECVLFYTFRDKRNHDFFIKGIEDAHERERAELKLRQVIDFCQSVDCRRRTVLRYLGERWREENCGACDICLAENDQVDATVIAQKILSAVIHTGDRFGARHVIDVLRGSQSSKVIAHRHDRLSVHGIARDHSVGELRHFIEQLVGRGLLVYGSSDYPTYQVTEAGRDFLQSRESLALARPSKPQATRTDSSRTDLEYDPSLFQKLRQLRKSIADGKGVPPYMVFPDRSLQQMSHYYPQSRDAFSHISGVGRVKLEEYGEDFLQVIRDHAVLNQLQERPIPQATGRKHRSAEALSQTHIQTRDLLRQGLSIEEVARQRGVTKTTIFGHVERLTKAGEEFDISRWLMPLERFLIIENAFHQTGSMALGPVRELLGDDYSYDEIRLVRLYLATEARAGNEDAGTYPTSPGEPGGHAPDTPAHISAEKLLSQLVDHPVTATPLNSDSDRDLSRQVEKVLTTLEEQETQVLRLKFGLAHGRGRTLQEIAASLDISKECVRRIEQEALWKLRLQSLEALFDNHSMSLGDAKSEPGSSYIRQIREAHPRAYAPWSVAEEQKLTGLFKAGQSINDMASRLERRPSAIRSRLKRLGLIPP